MFVQNLSWKSRHHEFWLPKVHVGISAVWIQPWNVNQLDLQEEEKLEKITWAKILNTLFFLHCFQARQMIQLEEHNFICDLSTQKNKAGASKNLKIWPCAAGWWPSSLSSEWLYPNSRGASNHNVTLQLSQMQGFFFLALAQFSVIPQLSFDRWGKRRVDWHISKI